MTTRNGFVVTGLRGDDVLLWHPEHPCSVKVDLPHVYVSKVLSKDDALSVLSSLKDLPFLIKSDSKMDFSRGVSPNDASIDDLVKLGQKYVIQLWGSPKDKELLMPLNVFCVGNKQSPDSRNNVSRMRRLLVGWPFKRAELDNNRAVFSKDDVSVDELLSYRSDAFDSEFEGWEPSYKFNDLDVSDEQLRSFVLSHGLERLKEIQNKRKGNTAKLVNVKGEHFLEAEVASLSRSLLIDKVKSISLLGDFQPFGISYVTDKNNFYFSIYDLPEERSEIDVFGKKYEFENFVAKSRDDLESCVLRLEKFLPKVREFVASDKKRVKTASQAITLLFAATKRAYNAFLTGGHNIGSYDYPNIRGSRSSSFLKCGINGRVPRIDAQLGFYERSVEDGRHNIDTCLVSQQFLSGTLDNKLKTFVEHFFGERDVKDLSYEETTKKRVEAAIGNQSSSLEVAKYAMKDAVLHYLSMRSVRKPIFLLSSLLRQSPEVVCSTSYKSLSRQLLQLRSLENRGCFVSEFFGDTKERSFDDVDVEDEKNALLFKPKNKSVKGLFETLEEVDGDLKLALKSRPAKERAEIFYLTPFVKAFSYFVEKNPAASRLVGEINSFDDSREGRNARFMLAQGLQKHYLGVLVHAALNNPDDYWNDAFVFERMFGVPLTKFVREFYSARDEFQDLIKKFNVEVLNSKVFTALRVPAHEKMVFRKSLEESMLGFYYASADVISTAQSGRFLLNVDGELMTQGIDVAGRVGLRLAYEQKVVRELVSRAFNGSSLVDVVKEVVSDLRSHRVPHSELVVSNVAKRDFDEYSSLALSNRRVWMNVSNGVKQGELFAWGYTDKGMTPANEFLSAKYNPELYVAMLFGQPAKKGWSFSTYSYARPDGKVGQGMTKAGRLLESVYVYEFDDKNVQDARRAELESIIRLRQFV